MASDPISIRDADGWFVEVNEAAARTLGYTHDEYLRLHVTDIAPPDLNPGQPHRLERLRAGETVVSVRKLRHRDGTVLEAENSSQLLANGYVFTISRDLTERRRQDAERQRLLTAVDQTAESIAVVGADGIVSWVNPAFCRLHGITLEEIAGRRPLEIVGAVDPDDPTRAEVESALAAGEPWSGRVRRRCTDGRIVDLSISISPIRGEKGRVVAWVEIGRDIGREVALEEQLRQAQNMETVGRLAGGIAHDFNNVLAAIRGFAELIHIDAPPGGEAHEMSGEIVRAADRGKALAARLLTFARHRPEEPVVVDLVRVVRESVPLLTQVCDERARVSFDLPPERVAVRVDPAQLEQALVNLVINARDAIAESGTIMVSVRREEVRPGDPATGTGLVPGSYSVLTVADSGAGIAPEALPHLFEPFFTTKPTGSGTGLGLSIVYSVVTAAGGRILVESAPGSGARFGIYLPSTVEDVQLETGAPHPGANDGGRPEVILVVDDEPTILALVHRMLERAGHRVAIAASAEAALQLLDETELRPGLLLSDIRLPGLSGIDLADAVRERLPGLPVVLMSGYEGDHFTPSTAPDLGRFLHKPFQSHELIAAVAAATGQGVPPGR
jgi:two-component system, cell cycle sensor histidine kinase and response regulator CckA